MESLIFILFWGFVIFGIIRLVRVINSKTHTTAVKDVKEKRQTTDTGSGAKVLPPEEHYPYIKKKYFLTIAERKFFDVLKSVVGDGYYIFPQVHLSSLLYVEYKEKKRKGYMSKINKKSVDFVIFDKQNISPFLAIELDDSSHNSEKRKKRDEFVNGALKAAGIPLLRVRAANYYNPEEIRKKMNETASAQNPQPH